MFFDNPKIREILKEYYGWSEEEIKAMQLQYSETVSKLVLDESMLYIERNNLPENNELTKLLQEAKPKRGDINTEVKLMEFVANIPAKYPELQEKIKNEIGQIETDLFTEFVNTMDEATQIKVLTTINDDLTRLDQISSENFPEVLEKKPSSEPIQ